MSPRIPAAFVALAVLAASICAQESDSRGRDDLLLLAVKMRHRMTDAVIPAYPGPEGVLLPLREIARLLEIPLVVDPREKTARGTLPSSGQALALDAVRGVVRIGSVSEPYPESAVEVHREDIYVDEGLLGRWLPAGLSVDLRAALVRIQPEGLLPSEERRRRETLHSRQDPTSSEGDLSTVTAPYRWFDRPFADLSLQVQGGDRASSPSTRHGILATGELLFLESMLFASGSEEEPFQDVRWSLGRRDPEGNLLGSIGAREVVLGESLFPGLEQVARPASGPGLLLSNVPLYEPTRFDLHTVRGDLPPGWEVEVFRNDELVGYVPAGTGGPFEIADIPLLFGTNRFLFVYHGPSGELRQEVRTIEVGKRRTPPGEIRYRLALSDPRTAGRRGLGEIRVGLTSRLGTSLSLARVELADGFHDYLRTSVDIGWNRLLAGVSHVRDLSGGSLTEAILQTRVREVGLSLRHAELDGFTSDLFRHELGRVVRRTSLQIDGPIPLGPSLTLPTSLRVGRDELADGGSLTTLDARTSLFHHGWAATNELRWTLPDEAGLSGRTARGTLLLSRFSSALSVRSEIAYDVEPELQATSFTLTGERRIPWGGLRLEAGARRSLRGANTTYLLRVNKPRGAFSLTGGLEYGEKGGLRGTVALNVGLAPDPATGGWQTEAPPVARMGGALVRAFLDIDGDGVFGGDDEPLPGVRFTINGAADDDVTRDDGTLLLMRLPPHRSLRLGILESSLQNPTLSPSAEAIEILSRAGKVTQVDYPVVAVGEITGTLFVLEDGDYRPYAGVLLELRTEEGAPLGTTTTAYDGFFDFPDLSDGRYRIRVPPDEVDRLGLSGVSERLVALEPLVEPFVDGADLRIARLPESEPGEILEAPTAVLVQRPVEEVPSALSDRQGSRRSGRGVRHAYGVQVAALRDEALAKNTADLVAERLGLPSHLLRAELPESGVWHRIVVGACETNARASELRHHLKVTRSIEVGPVRRLRNTEEGACLRTRPKPAPPTATSP